MSNTNDIVVFLDTLGRTIIAKPLNDKSTKEHLVVSNPGILNIIPGQNGTMQVQIIPMMFKELQGDHTEETVWYYNRPAITESKHFALDFKIVAQYNNIFSPSPIIMASQRQVAPASDVIKLFDD